MLVRIAHATDGQEQRREIDAFLIRRGLTTGRIYGQRRGEIAAAIGGEGFAERLLRFSGQGQFTEVQHRRVVEAPLDEVHGLDDGGAPRRLARFVDGLLAALEVEDDVRTALRIGHAHFAVEQAERGGAVVGDFQRELGAANDRRHLRSLHLELIRFVAMEEVEDALEEIEARLALALAFNADETARSDAHRFQIREAQERLAVPVRANPIAGIEHLVGVGGIPSSRLGPLDFDRALHPENGRCAFRLRGGRAGLADSQHGQEQQPRGPNQFVKHEFHPVPDVAGLEVELKTRGWQAALCLRRCVLALRAADTYSFL